MGAGGSVCASGATGREFAPVTYLLKKLLVPTFEEQFKSGVATTYSVDEQYVNTGAPSTRCLAITYPNA
jgi:hypothetical protein